MIKLKLIKIKGDEADHCKSAIVTKEVKELVDAKQIDSELLLRIAQGKAALGLFGVPPKSINSKNKDKFIATIHEVIVPEDARFKTNACKKEIKIEIWFFFTSIDYAKRDVDNNIKNLVDSLKGKWCDDDAQIKQIIAEKVEIKEFDRSKDKRLYEQILCIASVIE